VVIRKEYTLKKDGRTPNSLTFNIIQPKDERTNSNQVNLMPQMANSLNHFTQWW
jgi:hypothetical protein